MARLIQSIPIQPSCCQVVIVNNSPEDTQVRALSSPQVTILEAERNVGFGSACNLALRWIYEQDVRALVWIINPDAYLPNNPLGTLTSIHREHPDLSILGTIIKTFEGDIWFAGGRLEPKRGAITVEQTFLPFPGRPWNCDWVSGCSLIINLGCFAECPHFNPRYFLYYEDVEFCRRYAQAGHQIAMTQRLCILHDPSSITNRNLFSKTRHSTYSYLITLESMTEGPIFCMRFLKLLLHGILLSLYQPSCSLGKFCGIVLYLKQRWSSPALSSPSVTATRPKVRARSIAD